MPLQLGKSLWCLCSVLPSGVSHTPARMAAVLLVAHAGLSHAGELGEGGAGAAPRSGDRVSASLLGSSAANHNCPLSSHGSLMDAMQRSHPSTTKAEPGPTLGLFSYRVRAGCRRYVVNKVKGKLDELGRERTQLNVEKAALQREKEELQQQVEELARSVEKLNRDKVMLERELEAEEEQVTALTVLGCCVKPAPAERTRKAACQPV